MNAFGFELTWARSYVKKIKFLNGYVIFLLMQFFDAFSTQEVQIQQENLLNCSKKDQLIWCHFKALRVEAINMICHYVNSFKR